ncbi:NADH-quinone oxidoreductase subunit NuoN, partial [Nocardia gipuzkoensis]
MNQVLAAAVPAPSIEYRLLSPMLVVFAAAVIGVLVEAFAPRPWRYPLQLLLGFVGCGIALAAVIGLAGTNATAIVDAVAVDGVTLFLQGTILVTAILGLALMAERGTAPRLARREGPGTWSRAAATAAGA